MIGDGHAPGELGLPPVGVVQPPMAAHGAFEPALPGLIIGLDQVDAIILALGDGEHLVDDARLIDRGRQGALAHAPGARPSKLADENVLVRKCRDDLPPDRIDVPRRLPRGDREVLPVGQDMDADEIDLRCELAVTQPELPYVGIGDRHRDLRLDLPDGAGERRCRHFAAQQYLVADDDRCNHVGKSLGEIDRALDLLTAQVRQAREPQALQYLQAVASSDLRNLIEPMVGRIGSHAIGDLLELCQILLDLAGIDGNVRTERILRSPEWGIGDAVELLAGLQRRRRHCHRAPEPGPGGDDRRCCERKQPGRNDHEYQSRGRLTGRRAALV